MWIEHLTIRNFKSLKHVELDFGKPTSLLIGKNNVGKSSVIEALMLLNQLSKGEEIRQVPSRVGWAEILFGKDTRNELRLETVIVPRDGNIPSEIGLRPQERVDLPSFDKLKYTLVLKIEHPGRGVIHLAEELWIHIEGTETAIASGWLEGPEQYQHHILQSPLDIAGQAEPNYKRITNQKSSILSLTALANDEDELLSRVHRFFNSFAKVDAFRSSPDGLTVSGRYELASDGSDLPIVLHTLAAGKRETFQRIIEDAKLILGEIDEIRAPIVAGAQSTYLAVSEAPFGELEFSWKNVASGTKQVILLLTALHTAPLGSLMMIEEPEIHLHPDAIAKLVSLLRRISEEKEQQFLLTTHSPILVDAVGFEGTNIITKKGGESTAQSVEEFGDVERRLADQGILRSWLLVPHATLAPAWGFLLIVEGADDVAIWERFVEKSSLFSERCQVKVVKATEHDGGFDQALKVGRLVKLLNDIGTLAMRFKVVTDSDKERTKKEQSFLRAKLTSEDFHILSKKEIESYLLDAKAISSLTNKPLQQVEKLMNQAKGEGKEKLHNVLKQLTDMEMRAVVAMKPMVVDHMDSLPDEIESILKDISTQMESAR